MTSSERFDQERTCWSRRPGGCTISSRRPPGSPRRSPRPTPPTSSSTRRTGCWTWDSSRRSRRSSNCVQPLDRRSCSPRRGPTACVKSRIRSSSPTRRSFASATTAISSPRTSPSNRRSSWSPRTRSWTGRSLF